MIYYAMAKIEKDKRNNVRSVRSTDTSAHRSAILSLRGATCTSCSIAVEHIGRRLDGVEDIYVDRATSTIHVVYDNEAVLARICEFVSQLGYSASVKEKNLPVRAN